MSDVTMPGGCGGSEGPASQNELIRPARRSTATGSSDSFGSFSKSTLLLPATRTLHLLHGIRDLSRYPKGRIGRHPAAKMPKRCASRRIRARRGPGKVLGRRRSKVLADEFRTCATLDSLLPCEDMRYTTANKASQTGPALFHL